MAERILEYSTQPVTTRSSSYLTSIFGNGSLELARKNAMVKLICKEVHYQVSHQRVKEKEGIRVKRRRNANSHSLYERKRRDKINKKMRMLKELIPNCNKMDKASMLDDAIEYLKTLQLQLQIMSMGAGLCMPFMTLPTASHAPFIPMVGNPSTQPLLNGKAQTQQSKH